MSHTNPARRRRLVRSTAVRTHSARQGALADGETRSSDRPAITEYDPYYGQYIDLVPDGRLPLLLERGLRRTRGLVGSLTEMEAEHRYAPEKWSIKETLAHLMDAERTFAYRAFCFARGEPGVLPSFEPVPYVAASGAHRRRLRELLAEYDATRRAHIALFRSFDDAALLRTGVASGRTFSVRSLGYLIAGHERHHQAILLTRYFVRAFRGQVP